MHLSAWFDIYPAGNSEAENLKIENNQLRDELDKQKRKVVELKRKVEDLEGQL